MIDKEMEADEATQAATAAEKNLPEPKEEAPKLDGDDVPVA